LSPPGRFFIGCFFQHFRYGFIALGLARISFYTALFSSETPIAFHHLLSYVHVYFIDLTLPLSPPSFCICTVFGRRSWELASIA